MSRRGGAQAKTVAMYARLDQMAQEWTSISELAYTIASDFGRTYDYALRIVGAWAEKSGARREYVAKIPFFCLRKGAALDAEVVAGQHWGTLPERFRKDHQAMASLPTEDRIHGTLLAFGYLCLERPDCRTAFNNWAGKRKLPLIQRTFAGQKTSE